MFVCPCVCFGPQEIAAILISFERHEHWLSKEVQIRPRSGSMLLYSRKRVRYRRDGYCWKKRKDGKTTREDHMKLKVQGTEVSANRCANYLFCAKCSLEDLAFVCVRALWNLIIIIIRKYLKSSHHGSNVPDRLIHATLHLSQNHRSVRNFSSPSLSPLLPSNRPQNILD